MCSFTKNALAMIFVRMCEDISLKDIRIKDFIVYADVSKQTFYNHFRDKDDIMNYAYELAVNKIIVKMDASVDGAYYGALKMATISHNNKKFYRQLAQYETQNSFIQHFILYSEGVYKQILAEKQGTNTLSPKMNQIVHLYCVGVCTYFIEWMQKGMKESPEQIAEVVIDSMPGPIREIFESPKLDCRNKEYEVSK